MNKIKIIKAVDNIILLCYLLFPKNFLDEISKFLFCENSENFHFKSEIFKMYVVFQFVRFNSEIKNLDFINGGIKSYVSDKSFIKYP